MTTLQDLRNQEHRQMRLVKQHRGEARLSLLWCCLSLLITIVTGYSIHGHVKIDENFTLLVVAGLFSIGFLVLFFKARRRARKEFRELSRVRGLLIACRLAGGMLPAKTSL